MPDPYPSHHTLLSVVLGGKNNPHLYEFGVLKFGIGLEIHWSFFFKLKRFWMKVSMFVDVCSPKDKMWIWRISLCWGHIWGLARTSGSCQQEQLRKWECHQKVLLIKFKKWDSCIIKFISHNMIDLKRFFFIKSELTLNKSSKFAQKAMKDFKFKPVKLCCFLCNIHSHSKVNM